ALERLLHWSRVRPHIRQATTADRAARHPDLQPGVRRRRRWCRRLWWLLRPAVCRPDQVRRDRGLDAAGDRPLPLHAAVLREGRHDRIGEGLMQRLLELHQRAGRLGLRLLYLQLLWLGWTLRGGVLLGIFPATAAVHAVLRAHERGGGTDHELPSWRALSGA